MMVTAGLRLGMAGMSPGVLLSLALVISCHSIQLPDGREADKKYYHVDNEKLNDFWHHISVRALLRAKAKTLFKTMPYAEKVVYDQCASDARSLSEHAKCVVALLNTRDNEREKEEKRRREEKAREELLSRNVLSQQPNPAPLPPRPLPNYYDEFSPISERNGGEVFPDEPAPLPIARPVPFYSTNQIHYPKSPAFESQPPSLASSRIRQKTAHKKAMKKIKKPKWPSPRSVIRPQTRTILEGWYTARFRQKRAVDMDQAYQEFLRQERARRKSELETSNVERRMRVLEEIMDSNRDELPIFEEKPPIRTTVQRRPIQVPSVNLLGLPRVMKKPTRQRRHAEPGFDSQGLPIRPPITPVQPVRAHSSPNIELLARQKFAQFMTTGFSKQRSSNSEMLNRLRSHYNMLEKCNKYFKLMNDENRKFYSSLNLPLDVKPPKVKSLQENALEAVLELINGFRASSSPGDDKWSILSPRLMSIFPESGKGERGRVLSPNLLSFHEHDGVLSMPDLFRLSSVDSSYQQLMLDTIMELSGASEALKKAVDQLGPEMRSMREEQYPLVRELSRLDHSWLRAGKTYSALQQREMDDVGYTMMEREQLEIIYGQGGKLVRPFRGNLTDHSSLSREEKEERMERDIRQLAAMGKARSRRSVDPCGVPPSPNCDTNTPAHPHSSPQHAPAESGEHTGPIEFMTLEPHAFGSIVNHGIAMEVATLSPLAFIAEIMMPEALTVSTLSPRAFIATVLSPAALMARVLSPTAFRAEVLAPRALYAWVLSPEAFITETLTPRFLDTRILSPKAMIIDVLSPGILSPQVMSSELVGVLVLSPNILSPRIASEEKMLVEVLSPHILSGKHSHEEEAHDILQLGGTHEHNKTDGHLGLSYALPPVRAIVV